jgi:hypothetical protein
MIPLLVFFFQAFEILSICFCPGTKMRGYQPAVHVRKPPAEPAEFRDILHAPDWPGESLDDTKQRGVTCGRSHFRRLPVD